MKKKINKIVSCLLVLVLLVNVFAFERMTVFADEQKATTSDEIKDVTSKTVQEATGGQKFSDLDTKGRGEAELKQADEQMKEATEINDKDVNGASTVSLAELTTATSKVQSALIKVGTALEKIGKLLKTIGTTLKTIGTVMKAAGNTPVTAWMKPIGEALIKVGKIVYQVGNVIENIGKTIRTVGEAAQTGDLNFGTLISNVASTVKAAWTQGGTDYDSIDTSAYEETGTKFGDAINNFGTKIFDCDSCGSCNSCGSCADTESNNM